MPDNIERTIYKLDLDESGYTRGVDRLVTSTQRFSTAQDEANKRLQQSQSNLRAIGIDVVKAKNDLDTYTGSNERYRQQLSKNVTDLQKQQAQFTDEVKRNQKAYDDATAAAQRFNSAASQTPALPTPATGPVSGGILPTGSAGATLQSLVEQVRNSDFSDINQILDLAADNFEKFREATAAASEELEKMEKTTGSTAEETTVLADTVHEANNIIDEYDAITAKAGTTTLSYKTQINNLTHELQVLTEAGKENTDEFKSKEAELIKLTRAYKDQREQIRILSSETRALDFGKAALQSATTAMQGFTAAQILAGGSTEELQKKTFQLFAIMQLYTSLEQLHLQTKKQSVLFTNAQSAAQAIYTSVIGTTTGAVKALRIALLTTGIGAVVIGLGVLIAKILEEKEALEKNAEQQKLMNDLHEKAAQSASEAVAKLFIYKRTLNDLSIPEKERIKVIQEYNKEADASNKINEKQVNNLQLINEKLADQNKLLLENAVSLAANAKLTEEAQKLIQVRLPVEELAKTAGLPLDTFIVEFARLNNERNEQITKFADAYSANNEEAQKESVKQQKLITDSIGGLLKIQDTSVNNISAQIPKINQAIFRFQEGRAKFEDIGALLAGLIKQIKTKPGGGTGEIENVFEQEKQRLLDKLRQISIDEEEGIKKINDDFAFKFEQEQRRIADLLKKKKITSGQAVDLIKLSATVNKAELDKALKEFHDKIIAENKKLNQELDDLQKTNTENKINLIQDEFDRRRQLIEFNEQKEVDAAKKANADRLAAIDKEKGLIEESLYYTTRAKIVDEGEQELNNITIKYAQQRNDLALDIFTKSLDQFNEAITDAKLINDKAQLEEIKRLSQLFTSGVITYEEYRKKLSAVQEHFDRLNLLKQVDVLEQELRVLNRRRNNTLDTTTKEYDDLIKLIKQKETELVAARKSLETVSTGGGDTGTKQKTETVAEYAEAIGKVMDSVVAFWQTTNEAEAKALDRSIELQERRVTEAQKIAERGNASYLRMEEDRLKELQIAKENAARRQLAIDAALQASQLLVGVTGAIADLAKGPGGVARTIADIAIIVGALASGYALVRSLQSNQPKFATGTKSVKRTKEPAGTDTIPALLTEGEAVITRDKNKAYHPVIEAIHDGTVPADFLNTQVKKYHQLKSVPQVNYGRVKEAAETHIVSNGKVAFLMQEQNRKIDENNDLQRQTLNAMKHMSVSAKMDRDGIAIAVNEYMEKMAIAKKT